MRQYTARLVNSVGSKPTWTDSSNLSVDTSLTLCPSHCARRRKLTLEYADPLLVWRWNKCRAYQPSASFVHHFYIYQYAFLLFHVLFHIQQVPKDSNRNDRSFEQTNRSIDQSKFFDVHPFDWFEKELTIFVLNDVESASYEIVSRFLDAVKSSPLIIFITRSLSTVSYPLY